MAKEINTEILIKASPEKVWNILIDFDKYPEWNPFIKSLTGNAIVGNTIKVRLEPPGSQGMTIQPKVLVLNKYKEFRWKGHLLFPGIFDGEHKFELIYNKNGTTNFKHSEKFGGILIPLFKKMLEINTTNGFKLMNEKLKELAEKK